METRLLILNPDPVFQDRALAQIDRLPDLETQITRTLSETVSLLMREDFDLFVVEGEAPIAIEQGVHVRQHFPSLRVICLTAGELERTHRDQAAEQHLELIPLEATDRQLLRILRKAIVATKGNSGASVEGIDPCHSLVGNLNQFSAAEILQMSCMSQRSGRFTFKSGRGNSEVYLHHGMIRHAVYGSIEGEAAVAEVFRWRQGRFYFEEGLISQVQTVTRPWSHLLIDNLQKLDETLQLVGVGGHR